MIEDTLEEVFRHRESGLLHRVQHSDLTFRSPHARRHVREGYAPRLLLMQTNRFEMIKIAPLSRTKKLSSYECADLNVHVNSWYVQLRGGLDNLAWAMHYEWGLLGSGDEDDHTIRGKCHLFGKDFQRSVEAVLPELTPVLQQQADWAAEFKKLRDPIAHRVPMYAVPGVAFDDDKVRFESLNAEANAAAAAGDFNTFREKMFEAQEVGTYYHVFAMSGVGGIKLRRLPVQLASDAKAFLTLCESIVSSFEARCGLTAAAPDGGRVATS